MKVYITNVYNHESHFREVPSFLREYASLNTLSGHQLVEKPEQADHLLFAETVVPDVLFRKIRQHPIFRKCRHRAYLYSDQSPVFPLLPGVYTSVHREHLQSNLYYGGIYYTRLQENRWIQSVYQQKQAIKYLYSFVGADNCAMRHQLFSLLDSNALLKNTRGSNTWTLHGESRENYHRDYAEWSAQSAFILCPRGVGPSSVRIFEAMELGRVPVIISDSWTPPPFIPWEEFAVCIKEKDILNIPALLAGLPFEEMGTKARACWEAYVAKDRCFHYLIETLNLISEARTSALPPKEHTLTDLFSSELGRWYLRTLLRQTKRKVQRRLRTKHAQNALPSRK